MSYMSYRKKGSALRFHVGWYGDLIFDQDLAKGSPKAQTLKGAIIYALFSRIITIDFRNGPVHT